MNWIGQLPFWVKSECVEIHRVLFVGVWWGFRMKREKREEIVRKGVVEHERLSQQFEKKEKELKRQYEELQKRFEEERTRVSAFSHDSVV